MYLRSPSFFIQPEVNVFCEVMCQPVEIIRFSKNTDIPAGLLIIFEKLSAQQIDAERT